MATVTELFKQRYDGDAKGKKYTRVFHVLMDSVTSTPVEVWGASGIPEGASAFPGDADSVLLTKTAEQSDQQPKLWTVTCQYGPEAEANANKNNPDKGDQGKDPEDWQPRVSWSDTSDKVAITKCTMKQDGGGIEKANVPPMNSAGWRFDPPPEKSVFFANCRISYYSPEWKPEWIETYCGKLNSTTFWGYAAKRIMMTSLGAELKAVNGFFYWEITAGFQFRKSWDTELYDHGPFHAKADVNVVSAFSTLGPTEIQTPIDDNGNRLDDVLLDGRGSRLTKGAAPVKILISDQFETADFNFFTPIKNAFNYKKDDKPQKKF